jgi:hypothetical protein
VCAASFIARDISVACRQGCELLGKRAVESVAASKPIIIWGGSGGGLLVDSAHLVQADR